MFPDIDYTGTLPTLDPNSTLPELNFTLPAFTGTMPTELVTGTEPMTENGTETVTGTEATGTMETGTTGMRFQICPTHFRLNFWFFVVHYSTQNSKRPSKGGPNF